MLPLHTMQMVNAFMITAVGATMLVALALAVVMLITTTILVVRRLTRRPRKDMRTIPHDDVIEGEWRFVR